MSQNCDKCERAVDYQLFPLKYDNGDKLLVCKECLEDENSRADYLYDLWRENRAEEAQIEREKEGGEGAV